MEPFRNNQEEREEALNRRLRALPAPRAPEGLAARVMRIIEERRRLPWWRKSWAHWPAVWRAAFVLVAAGAAVGVGWGLSGVDPLGWAQQGRDLALSRFASIRAAVDLGGSLFGAALATARGASQTFWIAAASLAAASYVACLGLGTFCYRLVVSNSNRQLI